MSAAWGNYNARTSGVGCRPGLRHPSRSAAGGREGLLGAELASPRRGGCREVWGRRARGQATGESGEEREAEAQRLQGGPCLRPGRHPKCSGRGFQKEVTASLEAPVGARGNDGCSSPP